MRGIIRFCSKRCEQNHRRVVSTSLYVTVLCGTCGIEVNRLTSHLKPKTFCSKVCVSASRRIEGARWRDPSLIKSYFKEYQLRNASRLNQRARERNAAHPEQARERRRRWRQRHPDQVVSLAHRRRSSSGRFTPEEWRQLLELCGNACLRCNSENVTVDHIVPLTLDGTNTIANLQPLCKSCNSSKNNKAIDYRPRDIRALYDNFEFRES